jgi:hypothetical protein
MHELLFYAEHVNLLDENMKTDMDENMKTEKLC